MVTIFDMSIFMSDIYVCVELLYCLPPFTIKLVKLMEWKERSGFISITISILAGSIRGPKNKIRTTTKKPAPKPSHFPRGPFGSKTHPNCGFVDLPMDANRHFTLNP